MKNKIKLSILLLGLILPLISLKYSLITLGALSIPILSMGVILLLGVNNDWLYTKKFNWESSM